MPKLKHLKKYHKEAIAMKYRGTPYKDIAEKLTERFSKEVSRGFSDQTIKDWFKLGGTLHEDYRTYETEIDEIERENLIIIKKMGARIREENFRIANEMLVALIGSENDNVKLGAIRELLDRVEGKPKEAISIDEKHTTYEQIIRELEREQWEYEENEKKSTVGNDT
ncbi:MAG: hypothetical protein Q8R55_02425 [Candidatus Taylorbacteria bacterium]|nr:hypothetical protein [Candidatus Taylorbacteria bacterium]